MPCAPIWSKPPRLAGKKNKRIKPGQAAPATVHAKKGRLEPPRIMLRFFRPSAVRPSGLPLPCLFGAGPSSLGFPCPGPLPARIRPAGCGDRPPRFPPRFPAGISTVTRVPGDSPAHNARPRRSPRNAISINHRDMKSTNFMQVRLHKTVEFCNILLIFAKTLQISQKYFQFPLLSVNCGSTKPLPLGRKKSAAPGLGATLVQFGHFPFQFGHVLC